MITNIFLFTAYKSHFNSSLNILSCRCVLLTLARLRVECSWEFSSAGDTETETTVEWSDRHHLSLITSVRLLLRDTHLLHISPDDPGQPVFVRRIQNFKKSKNTSATSEVWCNVLNWSGYVLCNHVSRCRLLFLKCHRCCQSFCSDKSVLIMQSKWNVLPPQKQWRLDHLNNRSETVSCIEGHPR